MKEETNKKGRANSVTIFHADAPQLSASPSRRLWHRKVITKTEHTQQNKVLQINKTETQRRSGRHGNNHCPDLLRTKTFAHLIKLLNEKLVLQQ